MMRFDAIGLDATIRALSAVGNRQLLFASAKTLTGLAVRGREGVRDVMRQRFDRPTNFTLNSLFVRPATKTRQQAMVWIKNDPTSYSIPAAKWMLAEVYGGERRPKRFELAMRAGGFLSSGQYLIPGKGAPLDAHGNVRGSFTIKTMSALQVMGEQGYTANRSKSKRSQRKARNFDVFFGAPGGELGVWLRQKMGPQKRGRSSGHQLVPLFLVTESAPKYKVRVPFEKIVTNIANAHLERDFARNLKEALATARS